MNGRTRNPLALLLLLGAPTLVAADMAPMPGSWAHAGKVESAQIPGVPGFLAKALAGTRDHTTCLTAEQSAKMPHALLRQPGMECVARQFSFAGGRIAGVATCKSPRLETPLTIQTAGSYTLTSYAVRSVTTGTRKGKPMKVVTTGTGKRTGACS